MNKLIEQLEAVMNEASFSKREIVESVTQVLTVLEKFNVTDAVNKELDKNDIWIDDIISERNVFFR